MNPTIKMQFCVHFTGIQKTKICLTLHKKHLICYWEEDDRQHYQIKQQKITNVFISFTDYLYIYRY